MTEPDNLFDPVRMGDMILPNRVLMAPLTRNRAKPDGTPGDMVPTYYYQRASAGLIVSEATQISALGKGYINTPGIYAPEHVTGWQKIVEAVHAGGGRIFCQLWHVGRISHLSLLPQGAQPVSSTSRPARAQTVTQAGFVDCSTPQALDIAGIKNIVQEYAHAAKMALQAGFDGVEIHAANGYLIDQFLRDQVNDRTDDYGGSVENRARFLMEIVEAVSGVVDKNRIGVRLSPLGTFNDMGDSNPEQLFSYVYQKLGQAGLCYLHVAEKSAGADYSAADRALIARLRLLYQGFYIANGDYDAQEARAAIASGHADAIAFGRAFIANPDLPERLRRHAALNEPDPSSFYGGSEKGYLDYPALEAKG